MHNDKPSTNVCKLCHEPIPTGEDWYSPDLYGHAHEACKPKAGAMCRWSPPAAAPPLSPTVEIHVTFTLGPWVDVSGKGDGLYLACRNWESPIGSMTAALVEVTGYMRGERRSLRWSAHLPEANGLPYKAPTQGGCLGVDGGKAHADEALARMIKAAT